MPRKFRPKSFRFRPEIIEAIALVSRSTGASETEVLEWCVDAQWRQFIPKVVAEREALRAAETVVAIGEALHRHGHVDNGDRRTGGRGSVQRLAKVKSYKASQVLKPKMANTASGKEKIPPATT